MGDFAERKARLARLAAGIRGVASPADAWKLAEWLAPAVKVHQCRGVRAAYSPRRDGGARIVLPLQSDERATGLELLEEVGHWFHRSGLPDPPGVNPWLADRQEVSLDYLRELDEEGWSARFGRAVLLPPELVRNVSSHAGVEELVWTTGLTFAQVEQRLAEVAKLGSLWRASPDPWSAWSRYRVVLLRSNVGPRIRIHPRFRGEASFDVPVDERRIDETRRQIHLDLAALSPLEFRLKYAEERTDAPEEIGMLWEEIEGAREGDASE
jgi:hypothetical protein